MNEAENRRRVWYGRGGVLDGMCYKTNSTATSAGRLQATQKCCQSLTKAFADHSNKALLNSWRIVLLVLPAPIPSTHHLLSS